MCRLTHFLQVQFRYLARPLMRPTRLTERKQQLYTYRTLTKVSVNLNLSRSHGRSSSLKLRPCHQTPIRCRNLKLIRIFLRTPCIQPLLMSQKQQIPKMLSAVSSTLQTPKEVIRLQEGELRGNGYQRAIPASRRMKCSHPQQPY